MNPSVRDCEKIQKKIFSLSISLFLTGRILFLQFAGPFRRRFFYFDRRLIRIDRRLVDLRYVIQQTR